MFKDVMPVHWTRLVERPQCVDRIEIFMNEDPQVQEEEPTDSNLLSFNIRRQVCKKETLRITIYNKRGGLPSGFQEDQNFTSITKLYGVLRPELFFHTERLPDYSPTHYGKIRMYLTRNMFKDNNMEKCLTNIKVKTINNGTYEGIQDKINVFVNICEDETITIEYYHYKTIFSTKHLTISKLQDCNLKPSNPTTEGENVNEIGATSSEQPVNGTDKDKTGNNNKNIIITFVVIGVFITFLCIHENSLLS